nr:MAG TPA: hypothetical protein [Caudoviricetes sp.]
MTLSPPPTNEGRPVLTTRNGLENKKAAPVLPAPERQRILVLSPQ